MRERKEIEYHVLDGHDDIIDEKGNTTIRLRQMYYKDNSTNIKLDLRKWIINEDGSEQMGKGLSFLTEEGPHVLSEILTEQGYGKTKTILNNIKDREDFKPALNSVLGKEDENYDAEVSEDIDDTTYYDPRQCLIF